MGKPALTLEEKFHKFISPEPNSGCWLWTGSNSGHYYTGKTYGQYGKITIKGKSRIASRVMYEYSFGPFPKELYVLHKCDNPYCVNPEHLFLGTALDNARDRDRKKRREAPRGINNAGNKISEADVFAIREMDGTQEEIAQKFGIDQTTVSLIQRRKLWKHLAG